MNDKELTELALEIMKDFENLSTKSNIDPSIPIQSFDAEHDEICVTSPKQSDSVHRETISFISNVSSDSLPDILPPIPVQKQHQSTIIRIAGNKKRGIKRWAERQKLSYTSSLPLPHSELTKKINSYKKTVEYKKTRKQRNKKYTKKKKKYKKKKYKSDALLTAGIRSNYLNRYDAISRPNNNDKYNNASNCIGYDSNQYTKDNGEGNTVSVKNIYGQYDNESICDEKDSTRCMMDTVVDVNDSKLRENSHGQYDQREFIPLSLMPINTNDYKDNNNRFRSSTKSKKSKKKKNKKKKRKKQQKKCKIPGADSTKRTRKRKVRKVVSAPMPRLSIIL